MNRSCERKVERERQRKKQTLPLTILLSHPSGSSVSDSLSDDSLCALPEASVEPVKEPEERGDELSS